MEERPRFRASVRSPYPLQPGAFWINYDGILCIALNKSAKIMMIRYSKR